jgi:membrane protease YdiL (CAAX protease family)
MNTQDPDRHDQPSPPPEPTGPAVLPAGLWSRWTNSRLLIWGLLLLMGNFLLQTALFLLTDDLFLPVGIASLVAVVLPCLLAARSVGGSLAADFHLGQAPLPLLFWASIAALAALVPSSWLAELSMRIHPVSESWLEFYLEHLPQGGFETVLAVVTVVLLAPVAEELLFRGILYRLARRLWGPAAATFLSALAFALVHAEPWYLFGLFALGVLFAFIYEATGTLTACVVAHGLHNAISLTLLLGEKEFATGDTGAAELDLMLLGGSVLLLVVACVKLVHHGTEWRRKT